MTTILRRVTDLERARAEWIGPLVVMGEPTEEDRRAIEDAERIGRPVIRWPLKPPPIKTNSDDER